MILSFMLRLIILSSVIPQNHQINQEDFNSFLLKFYNDSIFQFSRTDRPLKGKIKYWSEDDSKTITSTWAETNELTRISSFQTIKIKFPNAKHTIEKMGNQYIEKIFIENSGFIMERKFKAIDGKWHLIEYDLTYL